MQSYKIDLITFVIKLSNLICMTKFTTFGKQMRVLESFHSSTNLSKKLKLHSFIGRREYFFLRKRVTEPE
jgi:hypothetical protein